MKLKRLIFSIIIFIILISAGFSKNKALKKQPNEFRFVTVKVLVVFYANTAGGELSDDERNRLKNSFELSRTFIWRNSKCRLNLDFTFEVINEFKNKRFFPTSGILLPISVEKDLIQYKQNEGEYNIIATIYKSPYGKGSAGGMSIFENKGYLCMTYPANTAVTYPSNRNDIDSRALWLIISGLQKTLGQSCYGILKTESMWETDNPIENAQQAGDFFSYLAESFRIFDNYLNIKSGCGKINTTADRDNDGLPDRDIRVSLDEANFGSDPTTADSDGDGLSDLNEFLAGIYQSSNPQKKDTDGDGYLDGHDEYPLHAIRAKAPKLTPEFESGWESWYMITKELDYASKDVLLDVTLNTKIYLNWDDDFLYFGCEMDAPANLHLDIDLLNDGWWHGTDNYRLIVDPFSTRFSEIHTMIAPDTINQLKDSLGNVGYILWDDDPDYSSKYNPILDERTVELNTVVYEQKYIIKIKIPNNPRIPFQLEQNQKIGLRIYFSASEYGTEGIWASVYEPYEFFDVILK